MWQTTERQDCALGCIFDASPYSGAQPDRHIGRQVTTGVVDSPPTMLVLDLTGIRFLAASGMRVLLETRERAALTETSLGLVHSTRAVNRVFDVLQLTICSRLTQHLPMPLPPNANLRSSVPPQAGVPDTGAGRVARRPTVKSGSEVTQGIAKPRIRKK